YRLLIARSSERYRKNPPSTYRDGGSRSAVPPCLLHGVPEWLPEASRREPLWGRCNGRDPAMASCPDMGRSPPLLPGEFGHNRADLHQPSALCCAAYYSCSAQLGCVAGAGGAEGTRTPNPHNAIVVLSH